MNKLKLASLLVLFIFGLFFIEAAFSASKIKPRKKTENKVYLKHADRLTYDMYLLDAKILVGNVALTHDGVNFFCDSAEIYESTNSFKAFGHVKMKQGDTLTLTCNNLYYNGLTQIAEARENVKLKHHKMLLETDSLNYDRLYNLGYFFEGGRLSDESNVLTADWGEYTPSTKEAVFNYNVNLTNIQTTITTDTLHYNTFTKITHLLGPSNIINSDNKVYTENGYYNTQTESSTLLNRSVIKNSENTLIADSILNENLTKTTQAFGKVYLQNKKNKQILLGEKATYNDSLGTAVITDNILIKDYNNENDTLFLHADTLKLFTYNIKTDSTYRIMHAYPHVRSYSLDVQMVCDSLNFNSKEKKFSLFYDPILWQNKQQILGENIFIYLNDTTIDSTRVVKQALLVEQVDSINFNQISSNEITSYFLNGNLKESIAIGNVHTIFFQQDNDSIITGMNALDTETAKLFMENKKLTRIWTPAAKGLYYPPILLTDEQRFLPSYAWFDYIRPKNKEDIFEWIPKKKGQELKESIRKKAPRQTLQKQQ